MYEVDNEGIKGNTHAQTNPFCGTKILQVNLPNLIQPDSSSIFPIVENQLGHERHTPPLMQSRTVSIVSLFFSGSNPSKMPCLCHISVN